MSTKVRALAARWPWLICFTLILAACSPVGTGSVGSPTTSGQPREAVIGVILPLSGAQAQSGQNSLRGIELMAEQINNTGGIKALGGAGIRLVTRDSTSDPSNAAAQFQQLISSEPRPLAVIGAYASSLTLTILPFAEQAQIPLCTTSFADELTQKGYTYIFQVSPKASAVGRAQLDYAVEIAASVGAQLKNIAIVFENGAYGTSQAAGLKQAAEARGLNIVLYEAYPNTIADATPLARKIIDARPDAIFPVSYIPDGIILVRALKAQGNTAPIIAGVGGFVTPDFGKGLGGDVEGIFSVDTSSPDMYGQLGEAYKSRYGDFMPQEAHDNAACLAVIAEALEKRPTQSSSELAQALHSLEFTFGAAGSMPARKVKFDASGANVFAKPIMVQWRAGQLVSVWPKDLARSSPIWGSGR